MKPLRTWALQLPASLVILLPLLVGLSACADQTETRLPATTSVLTKLPRVENSTKSPCWQQRQIAAQNSYLDTVEAKAEKVYKAPCEVDKQVLAGR